MTNEGDGFLRAEEIANELLDNVQRLKNEIEGYATARSHFGEVHQQLVGLSRSLIAISEQSAGIVQGLAEIGTPAILSSIKEAEETVRRSHDAAQRTFEEQNSEMKRYIEEMASRMAVEVANVRTECERQARAMKRTLAIGLFCVTAIMTIVFYLAKGA